MQVAADDEGGPEERRQPGGPHALSSETLDLDLVMSRWLSLSSASAHDRRALLDGLRPRGPRNALCVRRHAPRSGDAAGVEDREESELADADWSSNSGA